MDVETIDDVLAGLDAVIGRAREQKSRIGYFAALYRRVTRAVKAGLPAGRFQNPALLERLDVVFARRYLEALDGFQNGGHPPRSWTVAFEAARDSRPLVLQQLLAGMNAHINLDLGIAAAETAPGDRLAALEPDFNEINAVLAGQVGAVEQQLARVSPMIALLEKLGLRTGTCIINFSLVKARDRAWSIARRLAPLGAAQIQSKIGLLDLETAILGRTIIQPPPPLDGQLLAIRLSESNDVAHILDVLGETEPAAAIAQAPRG